LEVGDGKVASVKEKDFKDKGASLTWEKREKGLRHFRSKPKTLLYGRTGEKEQR